MMQLSGEPGNDEAYDEAVVSHHRNRTTGDRVIELFAGKILPFPQQQTTYRITAGDSEVFKGTISLQNLKEEFRFSPICL